MGEGQKWKLLPQGDPYLLRIAWRFLTSKPVLFGDFLFSYSSTQLRPTLRNVSEDYVTSASDGLEEDDQDPRDGQAPEGAQVPRGDGVPTDDSVREAVRVTLPVDASKLDRPSFSKEAISIIFGQNSLSQIYEGLLPMVVTHLELLLLEQLRKDNDDVVQMVRQFNISRIRCGAFSDEGDRQRLFNANKALSKMHNGPSWKPETITPYRMYGVRSWVFQPIQEFPVFPDRYGLGLKTLGGLVKEFRTLGAAHRERQDTYRAELLGLTGGQGPELIEAVDWRGRSFQVSEFEWIWNEGGEIRDRLESFISFWFSQFFETTTPRIVNDTTGDPYTTYNDDIDIISGTRLAEKIYNLTFNPVNFYMPELRNARARAGTAEKAPSLPRLWAQRNDWYRAQPRGGRAAGGTVEGIGAGEDGYGGLEQDTPQLPIPLTDDEVGWDNSIADIPPPDENNQTIFVMKQNQFRRLYSTWLDKLLGPQDSWGDFPTHTAVQQ